MIPQQISLPSGLSSDPSHGSLLVIVITSLESLIVFALLREVFQCSISICFWRVRHAWHKNLVAKCSETETCADIMRRLGQAINGICKENADLNSFEDFMEDFIDCTDFLDYFKAIWFPRMGQPLSYKS